MKRRTSSRRQVLDLESNTKSSSSPRRTWQTKYQQICLDHSQSQNGNKTTNEEKNKHPLLGLLSNYNSDSDDDTDKNSTVNLDEKVESFLKEISELTPLTEEESKPLVEEVKTKKETATKKLTKAPKTIQSTNVIIPSVTLSQPTPTTVQYPGEVYTAPTSAWQECYDESTGCCYYWNTETNAVTWEIPPELHAYKAALEQWNAQQLLLGQGVGMHQSYIHQAMVQNSHVNNKAELGSVKKRKGPPGHSSESEDEKIEMITSYGPTSGESESEAEASAKPPSHKKIKVKKDQKKRDNYVLEDSNSSSALQSLLTYGPDPGPPGDEANDEEYNSVYKNSLLSNIPDTGPPGEEEPDKMNEDDKFQIIKSPPLVEAVDETPPSTEIINSREEMIVIDPEIDGDKNSALQRLQSLKAKTSDESRSQSSIEEERNSEDEDSEGVDELSILDRLRSQARVLQDLGGEISDEVKGLIEPVQENITSQTEKENQSTVKVEKDFTPTSFSLVAGYGDDSDQEEESKSEEKLKEVVKPLFPILETVPKDTSVSSKSSNLNLKVIKLSARAKALINASNTTSKARATNFVNTPDGLKPADSIKLSEPEPESTSVGLVDSSIHLKSFSRKKRLEVTTNNAKTELPSTLTQDVPLVAMKTVEPSAEVNLDMPSTSTSKHNLASKTDNQSKIPSSLGYTTAWSYSSEQMSGERRGFGFSAESQPKKGELKKAPIKFIKAETLMPAKVEAVVIEREKQHKVKNNKTTTSTAEEVSDLSQLILAKVKFLAEGKEAVSPVQTMAIQIETLVTAWEAGGLNLEYWSSWLMAMDAQLISLEQAAAPKGWLCEWNRYVRTTIVSYSLIWKKIVCCQVLIAP
uniref:WW domain-containing protein n=1 Tax=Clastoptera arizonana TaxID=38151 RepID=A0A1B6E563_9HEMI